MDSINNQERRFASFVLDGDEIVELAIHAEQVLEATRITGSINPLPTSVSYLEGFMHLRDDAIPVINMKKRLGLQDANYGTDAKVAVVRVSQLRVGLLFDDIKDVFMTAEETIDKIPPVLQTDESVISCLIKLADYQRTIELLDLHKLLGGSDAIEQIREADRSLNSANTFVQQTYSRFVVFSSNDQQYGVPVEKVQEITFLSEIDDMFKNDAIEGVVQLREQTIPVINATRLLKANSENGDVNEETRVLVVNAETFQYGLIVDTVQEILSITDESIMPLPRSGHNTITGIYQRSDDTNIMLLEVDALIEAQQQELQSVARLKSNNEAIQKNSDPDQSRHLITADCYLVFSIGKNFAIELNDVQEIIEPDDLMELPAATGFDCRVMNLRGTVVPVINLNAFYGYTDDGQSIDKKLIIAKKGKNIIAIEVDRILTIYKQVQYKPTPSLNPRLSEKKDTLDRLIEFVNESGVKEHVLVINVEAMMCNYLGLVPTNQPSEIELKEKGDLS